MNTGKKAAGIIMSVFGGISLFIALIFTVVFLAVGGAMGKAKEASEDEMENFYAFGVEAQGTITDVEDGATIVEYYAEEDDSYHQFKFSVSNSAFREGDSIVVYYDRRNPQICMAPDLVEETYETLDNVFSGIGAGLGVFFGIIGLGLLIGGIILIRKSKSSLKTDS